MEPKFSNRISFCFGWTDDKSLDVVAVSHYDGSCRQGQKKIAKFEEFSCTFTSIYMCA